MPFALSGGARINRLLVVNSPFRFCHVVTCVGAELPIESRACFGAARAAGFALLLLRCPRLHKTQSAASSVAAA